MRLHPDQIVPAAKFAVLRSVVQRSPKLPTETVSAHGRPDFAANGKGDAPNTVIT